MLSDVRWRDAFRWETSKQTLYAGLRRLQVHQALARRSGLNDVVTVLNLHRVSPRANPFWGALHPAHFDDLLTFLERHFTITRFDHLNHPAKLPPLVLSFDDGYYDFVEYAQPILNKHRVPANQNVIGTCVLSGEAPWNVAMYDTLHAAPRSLLNTFRLPGFQAPWVEESDGSKQRYGLALSRFLKNRPRQERISRLAALQEHLRQVEATPTRMLRVAEVQALGTHVEVGSHSFHHESMGYESDEFFRDDFAACQKLFATTLQQPLTVYAFPNGSHRTTQVDFLLQSGVSHVLLVGERYAKRNARVLSRITISGKSPAETYLQAVGLRQLLRPRAPLSSEAS